MSSDIDEETDFRENQDGGVIYEDDSYDRKKILTRNALTVSHGFKQGNTGEVTESPIFKSDKIQNTERVVQLASMRSVEEEGFKYMATMVEPSQKDLQIIEALVINEVAQQ